MHVSKRTALAAAGVAAIAFAVPALADQHSPAGGNGSIGCNDGTITWTPTNLWPPNHKMVPVTITYTDSDGDSNTATATTTETTALTVNSVTETDGGTTNNALVGDDLNGSGAPGSVQGPDAATDTNTPPAAGSDGGSNATWTEDIRAERAGTDGHGSGRDYDINVTCSDMGGTNPTEATGTMQTVDIHVTVPHDQGVVKP